MSEVTKALSENSNSSYEHASPQRKRTIAVAAALELIASRVSTAPANGTYLEQEIARIGTYADQIQAALKVE